MDALDKGFMAGVQVTDGGAEGGHDDGGGVGLMDEGERARREEKPVAAGYVGLI